MADGVSSATDSSPFVEFKKRIPERAYLVAGLAVGAVALGVFGVVVAGMCKGMLPPTDLIIGGGFLAGGFFVSRLFLTSMEEASDRRKMADMSADDILQVWSQRH